MALRLIVGVNNYIGLSGDAKPTDAVQAGSMFLEEDTGLTWTWDGLSWFLQPVIALAKRKLDLAAETLEVLADVRDECRGTRLAIQEWFNSGLDQQHDFLEAAQLVRDRQEDEEP